MKYELSIILPVLNCLKYTMRMIPTIKTKYPYALILIDNASNDGTKDIFKSYGKKENVKVFINKRNIGCAASWNLGIKTAIEDFDSRYFFIPNNDTLLHPLVIDNLIDLIKDSTIGLATATDVSGKIPIAEEVFNLLPSVKSQITDCPDFSCFMLKKETIEKVGYFDEKFYPAYFEDNDYHYRLRLVGLRGVKTDKALFYHYGSRTIKEGQEIKTISNLGYTINCDYYSQKWGGQPGNESFKIPFGGK